LRVQTVATAAWTRSDLAGAFARAINADLTRPQAFAILSFCYLVLRLPYLDHGYGTDPDAWRVALTAHHLLETGEYFPSRLPGNPLHELITTLLIPGGWVTTNFVTALASLAGVYVFGRIVNRLQLPTPGLLTIAFAFTPLLYINSISTMDYMWTLTLILAAYYCVLNRLPLLAGVCIGLAIGLRLQSLILLPAFAFLFWRQGWLRDVWPFGFAAAGVAALAFSPVLAVYGLDFLNFYDASVGYQSVLSLLGKESLGVIGSLGVLAGAALSFRRLRQLPRDALKDPHLAFWLVLIALYFFSFFRLPHEIAYLIPVFPFGFLIMGRYFRHKALLWAVAAIFFAGFVDITTPGVGLSRESLQGASIGRGLILSNGDTMEGQREFVEDIMSADVPDHSVVIAGFIFPQLAVRERDNLHLRIIERDYGAISMLSDRGEAVDEERDIRYVWLLTYDTFTALRTQGYNVYQVADAAGSTYALYDYRPGLFGVTFLHLQRDQEASEGKGTADTDR
jgi:hypothetical protein